MQYSFVGVYSNNTYQTWTDSIKKEQQQSQIKPTETFFSHFNNNFNY